MKHCVSTIEVFDVVVVNSGHTPSMLHVSFFTTSVYMDHFAFPSCDLADLDDLLGVDTAEPDLWCYETLDEGGSSSTATDGVVLPFTEDLVRQLSSRVTSITSTVRACTTSLRARTGKPAIFSERPDRGLQMRLNVCILNLMTIKLAAEALRASYALTGGQMTMITGVIDRCSRIVHGLS